MSLEGIVISFLTTEENHAVLCYFFYCRFFLHFILRFIALYFYEQYSFSSCRIPYALFRLWFAFL
jgi:uncharacterized protein (DUF2164 family)